MRIAQERRFHDTPTEALRAAREIAAWDLADIDTDPGTWSFADESHAYLTAFLAAADAEIARRRRLRGHPLATAWLEPRAELDAIRERIDLGAYVERYAGVAFHRGAQLHGRCPFPDHEDRDPSFVVNPAKGLWYCHGCHRGGDAFSFVMHWLELDFPAAVDLLAAEAGIERPPRPALATPPVTLLVGGRELVPVRGGGRRGR